MSEEVAFVIAGGTVIWAIFSLFVFVDTWAQAKRTARAAEQIVEAVRSLHQTADAQRQENRRSVLLAKADYMRARGLPEDPEEIRRAFEGV